MNITIYSMPQVLFLTSGSGTKMNFPVNNSDFRLFKNMSNTIWVYIKDVDRKTVTFPTTTTLTINILDRKYKKLVYTGNLELLDVATSRYGFTINTDDISIWNDQSYDYVITAIDNSNIRTALYTDRGYSLNGVVHVSEGPIPMPITSVEIPLSFFSSVDQYMVSGAYPGAATNQNLSGLHTIAIYGTSFTGTVFVQASLALTAPITDNLWSTTDTINVSELSQILRYDFIGNYTWVRFKFQTTTGSFNKILYRG